MAIDFTPLLTTDNSLVELATPAYSIIRVNHLITCSIGACSALTNFGLVVDPSHAYAICVPHLTDALISPLSAPQITDDVTGSQYDGSQNGYTTAKYYDQNVVY